MADETTVAPPVDLKALAEAVEVYLADPTIRANDVGVLTVG